MVSDDEDLDCPLCMEEFDIADRNFRPCPCGYQICRFCWHHIKSNLNGRCPACRRMYSDQIAKFIPVSADEIVRLKKEKKEKERQTKDVKDSSRRHLSNVRVVQKNLVYVLGLSPKYASVENEFFQKYGKIAKLVVSKRSTQQTAGASSASSSVGIYVTYCRKEDAAKAIAGINGSTCDGRSVRASYGTTKYCTYYLRHMSCPNPNCMYLHEPGDDVDSYTKDNLSIGKHPSGSGNQSYPNKRITPTCSSSTTTAAATSTAATVAASAPKPSVRSSASADTQPDVPRKSAWAPIPKVAPPPPPPPPAPEPEVEEPEMEPEPVVPEPKPQPTLPKASSSASEQTKNNGASSKSAATKATNPIAIEKKPALPAAASWGKAANNLASSHESVATPTNFGPSLSDALTASQKPKHSPSIPRKKEKKLKSKMIRLEDFEEGVRTGSKQAKAKKEPPRAESALSAQISRQQQQGSPWKPIQVPSQDAKPAVEAAQEAAAEGEAEAPVRAAPIESKEKDRKETRQMEIEPAAKVEQAFQAATDVEREEPRVQAEPLESSLKEKDNADKGEYGVDTTRRVEEEDTAMSGAKSETDEDVEHDEYEQHDSSSSDDVVMMDKTAALDRLTPLDDSVEQPSFANYVLGSLMVDDDDRSSEEVLEGGLSSLKGDLDSEYDGMLDERDYDRGHVAEEVERSEKVQEDEQHGYTSPLLAMERFSALINQELAAHSPERSTEEFDRRPMAYQPPSLFQELGLPFESSRPHGPPPGIPGPPEWRTHNFDPFNGQDPVAARRLQHSQQMLEASGLFPGFAPRPPPLFGVSPDFHAAGTPPPPPPPQGPPPPPGIFGLPPAPIMHHPDFLSLPPGLSPMADAPDIAALETSMRTLHLQQNGRSDNIRNMQDDLRALLPNVNISFGPMRDDHPPSNKPHTPSHDEPEFLHRRLSDSHRIQPRFDMNHFGEPRDLDRFSPSPLAEEKTLFMTNGSTHKPDALPENDRERVHEGRGDMKQEAQNFFGEFLRKAAATGGGPMHMSMAEAPRKASLPFQDPAIMSVRMSHEAKQQQQQQQQQQLQQQQDITESQNTILQILGGQPPPPQHREQMAPPQHREQMLLNQAMRSPPEDAFGRDMQPKPFDFFMAQQQHQQHQQHQQPPPSHQHPHQHPPPPMPFHHHQPPPPAHPPPFMSGYMGVMPPPHYHHHMQDPPPGMMPMPPQPPPPLPIPMQVDMGYRPRNGSIPGNFPPGLFPGGARHDGM